MGCGGGAEARWGVYAEVMKRRSLPPSLRTRTERHRLLEAVVRDGLEVVDVVEQDEFTHDVIVRAPGESAGWLVYDTT